MTEQIQGERPVLSVRDLSVDARTPAGLKQILNRVSFDLAAGRPCVSPASRARASR